MKKIAGLIALPLLASTSVALAQNDESSDTTTLNLKYVAVPVAPCSVNLENDSVILSADNVGNTDDDYEEVGKLLLSGDCGAATLTMNSGDDFQLVDGDSDAQDYRLRVNESDGDKVLDSGGISNNGIVLTSSVPEEEDELPILVRLIGGLNADVDDGAEDSVSFTVTAPGLGA